MNSFLAVALTLLVSPLWGLSGLHAGETLPTDEIQRLTKELSSADYETRLKAQDGLVSLARTSCTQLAAGLGSEDLETRQGVAIVLAKVENELRICRIEARIPEPQRAALRELSSSKPQLYGRLGHPDPAERKKACVELAGLPADLAIPVLAALAADDNRTVRNHAVHALGLTGDVKALPCLKEWVAFSDTGPDEQNQVFGGVGRVFAINGIVGIGGETTNLETRLVSEIAVESIGKIKHADAARFLIEGLAAPNGASFLDYLNALEKTGQTDAAVTALLPKLDDTKELNAALTLGAMAMARLPGNTPQIQPKTVGDAAFLSILRMTDQKPEAYGINPPAKKSGRKGEFRQGISIVSTDNGPAQVLIDGKEAEPLFPNEAARTTAIENLKTWWKHSKDGKTTQK